MQSWRPFGKFKVGINDLDWLGTADTSPSQVDPKLHLTGRLFYPCQHATAGARNSWLLLWRGVPWLPGFNYAKGLMTFLFFRTRGLMYYVLQKVLQNFNFLVGRSKLMDFYPGAALVPNEGPHPVLVFSHGLGGNRVMYSIMCSELASQGYVVLALEHADGSSSACKLAGDKGWRFYLGLGGEEGQVEKTRHRVQEMKTALRVLTAMNTGDALPGLRLSNGADPSRFLCGALDFNCLAAMGHSYGGATATALIAEDSPWKCGVALDPWWYAMPPEAAALRNWQTSSPLMVMGSHDWNIPNAQGQLPCGEDRQNAILQAAKARKDGGVGSGGGALLLVVMGTSHNTFADPLALFSQPLGWMLERLGLASRLDPVLGIHLVTIAALNFLSTHLPLTPKQRAMQSWEPSKGGGALRRIKERTVADQATDGLLARVFPQGKGLIDTLSDLILNRALKFTTKPVFVAIGGLGKQRAAAEPEDMDRVEASAPDDVVTTTEALEAALPSADPASGPHPHAPSEAIAHQPYPPLQEAREDGTQHARVPGEEAGVMRVLASIGLQYTDAVQQEEARQYEALLGAEHIYKCDVHV